MSSKKEKLFLDALAREEKINSERMAKLADYKIQIWFKSDRSMKKPIAFSLTAWQSGKRLHGGGDEMMFMCRRTEGSPDVTRKDIQFSHKKEKISKRGCGAFIPGENNAGLVICPSCGAQHRAEHIADAVFYRLPVEKAAHVLEKWFHKLGGRADIYAKYTPTDPRTLLMSKSTNFTTAREKKGLTIYPLQNIITDTANGSTLHNRFKAFILA